MNLIEECAECGAKGIWRNFLFKEGKAIPFCDKCFKDEKYILLKYKEENEILLEN